MPGHPAVAFHLRGHIDAKCTGWLPPHVLIHGAALKDPDNIFNAELEGNKRRGGPFSTNDLESSWLRRARGIAVAQIFATFALVQHNLKKIATFL